MPGTIQVLCRTFFKMDQYSRNFMKINNKNRKRARETYYIKVLLSKDFPGSQF